MNENEEPTECASCGFEGAKLTAYHPPPMRRAEEDHWLCEVCANTRAGKAYNYPEQYRGQTEVLQSLS